MSVIICKTKVFFILTLFTGNVCLAQNSNELTLSGFTSEVQVLINKANGKSVSHFNNANFKLHKLKSQSIDAAMISINYNDGTTKTPMIYNWWDAISNANIQSVNCRKDACKDVLILNFIVRNTIVASVYFLEADRDKMQAILDKYSKK